MTVKIIETAQPIAPKKDWWGCGLVRLSSWGYEMVRGDERRRRDCLTDCVSCAGEGFCEYGGVTICLD